jgi:hypothetical protein
LDDQRKFSIYSWPTPSINLLLEGKVPGRKIKEEDTCRGSTTCRATTGARQRGTKINGDINIIIVP